MRCAFPECGGCRQQAGCGQAKEAGSRKELYAEELFEADRRLLDEYSGGIIRFFGDDKPEWSDCDFSEDGAAVDIDPNREVDDYPEPIDDFPCGNPDVDHVYMDPDELAAERALEAFCLRELAQASS